MASLIGPVLDTYFRQNPFGVIVVVTMYVVQNTQGYILVRPVILVGTQHLAATVLPIQCAADNEKKKSMQFDPCCTRGGRTFQETEATSEDCKVLQCNPRYYGILHTSRGRSGRMREITIVTQILYYGTLHRGFLLR